MSLDVLELVQPEPEKIIGKEGTNTVGIIGNPGMGKSLLLTAILCWEITHERKYAFANYHIKYVAPNGRHVEYVDFGRLLTLLIGKHKKFPLGSAVLALDEAYLGLDSRESGSTANKFLTSLLFQSRKLGIDLYYAAQLGSRVDKSLRGITGITIVCEKTSVPRESNPNQEVPQFNYYLMDTQTDKVYGPPWNIGYDDFLEIIKYYDTQERVTETELQVGKEKSREAIAQIAKLFESSREADLIAGVPKDESTDKVKPLKRRKKQADSGSNGEVPTPEN